MKVFLGDDIVAVEKGSFSLSDAIEERSTCSFVVVDINNIAKYTRGTRVSVQDEVGELMFSGYVERVSESKIVGDRGLFHRIDCIDQHYLADKRVIAESWKKTMASSVLKDIVQKYLSAEGVTYIEDTLHPLRYVEFATTTSSNYTYVNSDNFGYKELKIRKRGMSYLINPNLMSNTSNNLYTITPSSSMTTTNSRNIWKLFNNTKGTDGIPFFFEANTYFEIMFNDNVGRRIEELRYYSGTNSTPTVSRMSVFGIKANGDLVNLAGSTLWLSTTYEQKTVNFKPDPILTTNPDVYQQSLDIYNSDYVGVRVVNNSTGGYMDELNFYSQEKLYASYIEPVSNEMTLNYSSLGTKGHTMRWKETKPLKTDVIKVETSLDNSTWFIQENGQPISCLLNSDIVTPTGQKVYVKVRITPTSEYQETPIIEDIRFELIKSFGSIEATEIVDEAVFNYIPISEAIGSIAEKTESWWKIDANKVLHFGKRHTYTAPFAVDNMKVLKGSIKVDYGNNEYRNQQYIIGGKDVTDLQTERFKGNDTQQSFVTAFPLSEVPTLYINNVPVPRLGIRGLSDPEDGYEWFWSKGSNVISQDEKSTPLTSNQILKVEYRGQFDVIVMSKQYDSIDFAKNNERNSGIVEHVTEDNSIASKESGFSYANKLLDKYGKIGIQVEFDTPYRGLQSGQLVTVNFPVHSLVNEQLLIESVDISYENEKFFYKVRAIKNTVTENWTKFFYKLGTQNRSYVIRENIADDEVLTTLEMFFKTWALNDVPNIFRENYPSSANFPSETNYPMFKPEDRIKYISWFKGDVELGRKAITKQTWNEDSKELISIVYLSQNEANEEITHFGWFGGHMATEIIGTGILIDKQAYMKEKSDLEAIEIDRIDKKGW